MAIGISYLPATVISRLDEATPEEKESLQSAKAVFREPVNFDFENAFIYLRDEGLDTRNAMDAIAKKLGEKSGFDVVGAREAGFTTEQIVAKLIGRDPDDLDPDAFGSFFGGLGRGFTQAAPGGALGALATGLVVGSGGTALPALGAGFLTALIFEKATGAGQKLEDVLFEERQILPSERFAAAPGEVIGSLLAFSPTTKIGLSAIGESVDLGSKKLLRRHYEQRAKAISQKLSAEGKPVSPGEALRQAYTEAVPGAVKRREFFENTAVSIGQKAREQGNLRFAA